LIKFLPQLAVIVDSIIHGFDSIAFIAIILAVVYYMFAILGMMLFEKNDPFHFGYLHRAMLTLFRICTFDDWTDVMYINVYGCKQWGYSDDDSKPHAKICNDTYYTKEVQWNWAAAFYFIIFCVLGALVLLTLFIGVVTTSMEEAYGIAEAKQEAFDRMISNAESRGVKRIACEAFLAAFSRIDEDQSGYASVPELVSGLKSVGFKATAVELRAALRAMPFESKSPEGELDPFEFFLFIIDMAENRPSFFFGGDDEELNPTNAADINPQRVFSRKLDDSDEDSPSNESSNATTPSHEQNHEQAPRHSTAERLSKERDPRLLKSSINKLIEAEKTKRGLSVDRPPDQGQTPKSKGVMFSPSTKPDKPLILIRPGVPGSSI
jgi:hypothetical protein